MTKRQTNLLVITLGTAAVLGVLIWFGYAADWTGFREYTSPMVDKSQTFTRAKTLWDWLQLLIIPVAIALGVFWLNHEDAKRKLAADERRAAEERQLAAESSREEALTSYFDTIAKLLLESDLRASAPESPVREVARAYTLAVLPRLDGLRKGMVLQFLSSANLITKPDVVTRVDESGRESFHENRQNPIIKLIAADFSGVSFPGGFDLNQVDLSRTDLRCVNLRKADLRYVNLRDAWLQQADLRQANCRYIECWKTDFGEALVDGTDFEAAEGDFPGTAKGSPV